MNPDVKKSLIFTVFAIVIAAISIGTTLIIQKIIQKPAPQMVETPAPIPEPTPVATPTAQIISIKPHYINVSSTHKNCHPVQHVVLVHQPHYYPAAGAVLGGVTGAVIGNTVVNGDSRTAATIAGAAIGAVGGNAIQRSMNHPKPYVVTTPVCSKTTTTKKVQKGYEVTYIVDGQKGMVIMPTQPTGTVLPLPIQEES